MTQTLHGSLWGGRRWSGEDKESAGTIEESMCGCYLCVHFRSKLRTHMAAENGGLRAGSRVSRILRLHLSDALVKLAKNKTWQLHCVFMCTLMTHTGRFEEEKTKYIANNARLFNYCDFMITNCYIVPLCFHSFIICFITHAV